MWEWFKHAFGVEPPGVAVPTEEQAALVDKLCHEVVRRRMVTPALMFLEMSQPLNFLSSQALHFFTPIISAVTSKNGHKHLAEFLEHRGSIDYICQRLEALEHEAEQQQPLEPTAVLDSDCENGPGDTSSPQ